MPNNSILTITFVNRRGRWKHMNWANFFAQDTCQYCLMKLIMWTRFVTLESLIEIVIFWVFNDWGLQCTSIFTCIITCMKYAIIFTCFIMNVKFASIITCVIFGTKCTHISSCVIMDIKFKDTIVIYFHATVEECFDSWWAFYFF